MFKPDDAVEAPQLLPVDVQDPRGVQPQSSKSGGGDDHALAGRISINWIGRLHREMCQSDSVIGRKGLAARQQGTVPGVRLVVFRGLALAQTAGHLIEINTDRDVIADVGFHPRDGRIDRRFDCGGVGSLVIVESNVGSITRLYAGLRGKRQQAAGTQSRTPKLHGPAPGIVSNDAFRLPE